MDKIDENSTLENDYVWIFNCFEKQKLVEQNNPNKKVLTLGKQDSVPLTNNSVIPALLPSLSPKKQKKKQPL